MGKNTFVLDVNVWISGLVYNKTQTLSKIICNNDIVVYRSEMMLWELRDVLSRPKHSKKIQSANQLDFVINQIEELTCYFPTTPMFKDCRDPDDNYLFDLAIQSQADYLVSGDGDVLDVKINPPPQIISYTQFSEMFL